MNTLVLFFSLSPAEAKGGFVPPLKIDYGTTTLISDSGNTRSASQLSTSLNWASLYPERTKFDIGVGFTAILDPKNSEGAKTHNRTNRDFTMHGGFLEFSRLVGEEGAYTRAWLGTRVEMLRSNGQTIYGISARLSAEIWKGLAFSEKNTAIFGVGALGLWAELGIRQLPNSEPLQHASVGLSVRLPLVISG